MATTANSFRIFFRHRTDDTQIVDKLKDVLKNMLPNFSIKDISGEVPNRSDWKIAAEPVIGKCDAMVCLIGATAHESEPIDWEIREAHRLGKPLLVTTLSTEFKLPPACSELRIDAIPWEAGTVAGQIGEMLVTRGSIPTLRLV